MADWTVGSGYDYSDIVLMDKSGNPITHQDITLLEVDMADGRVQPYHDISTLRCYSIEPTTNESYTVKAEFAVGFQGFFPFNYGVIGMFTTDMLQEYGYDTDVDRRLMLFYTLKRLEIGKTYSRDYLTNQGGE